MYVYVWICVCMQYDRIFSILLTIAKVLLCRHKVSVFMMMLFLFRQNKTTTTKQTNKRKTVLLQKKTKRVAVLWQARDQVARSRRRRRRKIKTTTSTKAKNIVMMRILGFLRRYLNKYPPHTDGLYENQNCLWKWQRCRNFSLTLNIFLYWI